ncbi:hypothetical protein TNCV_1693601 [Trichonephila clavipes]|nr:hypothetical protein TNCV_1693601 [Trichonephila clavipes]
MQSLHPKPPKHHGKRPVFIHPGLLEETHVFLRRDMLRRPHQQPYDDPFKVLQRKDKVFFLDINGKRYLYLLIDANLPVSYTSHLTVTECARLSTPHLTVTECGRLSRFPTPTETFLEPVRGHSVN